MQVNPVGHHCNLAGLVCPRQVCVPWVQPGLCCGDDEEPRSCGEPPAGRPTGGRPAEGGSPLEGARLPERMHPGETGAKQKDPPVSNLGGITGRSTSVIFQGADISSSQHRDMILWLGDMNRMFHFCPETFALGVCILNRLLSTVKVHGCSTR